MRAVDEARRRSLARARSLRGRRRTRPDAVAIDWSLTGLAAVGEDIANLVSDSFWLQAVSGTVAPTERDIAEVEREALEGYSAGLRDAGWRGEESHLRFTYAATTALRFGLLSHSLVELACDAEKGAATAALFRRPLSAVIGSRAAVVSHALSLAVEAREQFSAL